MRVFVQIDEPVAVIAVVGLYRTGKSFLMNRILLNQAGGFQVGNSATRSTGSMRGIGSIRVAVRLYSAMLLCKSRPPSAFQIRFHERRIRLDARAFSRRQLPTPRPPSPAASTPFIRSRTHSASFYPAPLELLPGHHCVASSAAHPPRPACAPPV